MNIENNILVFSVHDWENHWDMKIDLHEVFYGDEPRELPDYKPDPDDIKITRWQRIKGIIKLIKKNHLEDELEAFKDWLRKERAGNENLRNAFKAGSSNYKYLTKRITLIERAIREVEK